MEFDVTKPLQGRAEIKAAVDLYKDALRRPERETPAKLRQSCWPLFALSLLPVFCVLVASLLAPSAQSLTKDTPATTYETEIGAGKAIVAADLAARIKALDGDATDPDAARAIVEELTALDAAAEVEATKDAVKTHARYRSLTIFIVTLTAFSIGCLIAINAQLAVIKRHWNTTVAERATIMALKPRVLVNGFSALGALAIAAMLLLIDLPGPLSVRQTAGILWSGPEVALYLVMGCAVLILGLVTSLIFATGFGTFLFGRSYPSTAKVEEIGNAFYKASKESQLLPTRAVTALYEKVAYEAENPPKTDATLEMAIKPSPKTNRGPRIGSASYEPLIDWGLPASDCMIVIRRFSTVAAMGMIFALLTLALGIDVLELSLTGPDSYVTAIKASGDTWLMVLGAGMSAALVVLFGWPTLRLMPISQAEPKAPKPSSSWKISGVFAGPNVDLTAAHPSTNKSEPLWDNVTLELGSTEAKFKSILGAQQKGGAFHELADQTAKDQISRAAGLLSPAIAGGLLTLLG